MRGTAVPDISWMTSNSGPLCRINFTVPLRVRVRNTATEDGDDVDLEEGSEMLLAGAMAMEDDELVAEDVGEDLGEDMLDVEEEEEEELEGGDPDDLSLAKRRNRKAYAAQRRKKKEEKAAKAQRAKAKHRLSRVTTDKTETQVATRNAMRRIEADVASLLLQYRTVVCESMAEVCVCCFAATASCCVGRCH